jgi:uncharacterized membrane protein YczE
MRADGDLTGRRFRFPSFWMSFRMVESPRRALSVRWTQLLVGLFGFAVAIALMIRSGLGLGPWDAFHVGIHLLTGITVGTASILAGLVIVAISMALKARLGPATIANMVLIGIFTDLVLMVIPPAVGMMIGFAYHIAGIALIGLSSGMYLGAGLGAGPRDSLMTALSARYGWSISRTRTGIELSVLGLGWLMGGTLGIGTVLFAVAVGPSVQWGMRLFGLLPRRGHGSPVAGRGTGAPAEDPEEKPASIA